MAEIPGLKATNVVLVHGGFVDGSGWEGVYKILTKDGYTVSVVQNPTMSPRPSELLLRRMAQWFSSATPTAEW
jgi:hypothetical protein